MYVKLLCILYLCLIKIGRKCVNIAIIIKIVKIVLVTSKSFTKNITKLSYTFMVYKFDVIDNICKTSYPILRRLLSAIFAMSSWSNSNRSIIKTLQTKKLLSRLTKHDMIYMRSCCCSLITSKTIKGAIWYDYVLHKYINLFNSRPMIRHVCWLWLSAFTFQHIVYMYVEILSEYGKNRKGLDRKKHKI